MTMGAQAWAPSLSEMSSTIASGETGQVVFTLTVPADSSAAAKSGMAMVHAYSEICGDDQHYGVIVRILNQNTKHTFQWSFLPIKSSISTQVITTIHQWLVHQFKKEWLYS